MLSCTYSNYANRHNNYFSCIARLTHVNALMLSLSSLPDESRLSTSPSTDNDYCEDNPGVCIGVPVAVSLATVVAVMLLFVYPTTRNMICELLIFKSRYTHNNSISTLIVTLFHQKRFSE